VTNLLNGINFDSASARFDQFVGIAKGAFQSIKDFFGTIFEAIGPDIGKLFDQISIAFGGGEEGAKSFGEILGGFVGGALNILIKLLTQAVGWFNENRVQISNIAQVVGGALSIAFNLLGGLISGIGKILGPIITGVGNFIQILKNGLEGIQQIAGLALRGLEALGVVADGTADSFLGLNQVIEESSRISNLTTDEAFSKTALSLQNIALQASSSSEIFKSSLEASGISAQTLAEQLTSGAITTDEALNKISLAAQASQQELGATGEVLAGQFQGVVDDFYTLSQRSGESNQAIIDQNTQLQNATNQSIQLLSDVAVAGSDSSSRFSQSLEASGLSADTLSTKLQDGSISIQEAFRIISDSAVQSSNEFGASGEYIESALSSIASTMDSVTPSADNLSGSITAATDISSDAVDSLLDSTQTAAAGMTNSLVGASQDIASDAVGGFTEFAQSGTKAVNDITKGTQEGVSEALAASQAIAKSAAEGVADLPATFKQIAIDLVNGFTSGIRSKVGEAAAAAGALATAASTAAKANLKIKSPSKVFQELGGFTAEGFLIGIEEGTPEVINSMGELAEGLKIEAVESNEKLKLNFTRAFESISKVVDDSLKDANDAIKQFVSNNEREQDKIRSQIEKTQETIESLTKSFEEQNLAAENSFNSSALNIVIDAEKERENILKNIAEIQKEIAFSQSGQIASGQEIYAIQSQIEASNSRLNFINNELRSDNVSEKEKISLQQEQIELKKKLIELSEQQERIQSGEAIGSIISESDKLDQQQKALDLQKELIKLNEDLGKQNEILNLSDQNQLVTTEQLEEAKRKEALNPLEALIESFNLEKEARQIKFEEDLLRLQEEETALSDSLVNRETELADFYSSIKNEDESFTQTYLAEITTREAATTSSIGKLIERYNALAAARRAAGGGAIASAALPGFAEGGYTGDGGKFDVAGKVHRGEYVVTQKTLKSFPNLMAGLELLRYGSQNNQPIQTTNNNQRSATLNATINNPMDLALLFNTLKWKLS